MTMYEVINYFTDLQDGNHEYKVGYPFPREGLTVSDERIAELSGSDNKQGKPLIKKVEQKPAAKKAAKAAAEK